MGRRNVHSKTSHPSKVDAADQTLLGEAKAITDAARQHSIHLRLLGAVAIHLRCGDRGQVTERLNRLGGAGALFSDLDFAAYGVERAKVRTLLEDRFGLTSNPQAMLFHGKDRLLYAHPSMGYDVDVFFDRLEFSHTIDLGRPGQGCLEEDSPTLPLADLLLSKIQFIKIPRRTLKTSCCSSSRMNPRRGTPLAESEWRGSRKPWPRTGVSGRTAPPTSRRSNPHPDDTERRDSSNPRRSNGCRATLLLSWRRSKRPRSHDRGEGENVDSPGASGGTTSNPSCVSHPWTNR